MVSERVNMGSILKLKMFQKKLLFFLLVVLFWSVYIVYDMSLHRSIAVSKIVQTEIETSDFSTIKNPKQKHNKFGLSDDFLITPYPCYIKEYTDKLLIIVTSKTSNFEERESIRNTWASNLNVDVYFILGVTSNSTVMDLVLKESYNKSDIIVKDFVDSFENLTLKMLSALEWSYKCTNRNFILKTDDDVFVNVPILLKYIKTLNKNEKKIYGNLAIQWKPIRKKDSKYYVSSTQYNRNHYPNFLTGPAYLLNYKCINDLYTTSFQFNYFKLEDVFLTGIVAENLKIARKGDKKFTNRSFNATKRYVCRFINIHKVRSNQQSKYFEFVHNHSC